MTKFIFHIAFLLGEFLSLNIKNILIIIRDTFYTMKLFIFHNLNFLNEYGYHFVKTTLY